LGGETTPNFGNLVLPNRAVVRELARDPYAEVIHGGPISEIDKMACTSAIRCPKAWDSNVRSKHREEQRHPIVFTAHWTFQRPYFFQARNLSEIVNMPVRSRRGYDMMLQPTANPAPPHGAANVDVESRVEIKSAKFADQEIHVAIEP
jgi:hypothetical protein